MAVVGAFFYKVNPFLKFSQYFELSELSDNSPEIVRIV